MLSCDGGFHGLSLGTLSIMGATRLRVNKALSDAHRRGLVRITFNTAFAACAELEAALTGPGGLLTPSTTDGNAPGSEVVESLRRFLAAKPKGAIEDPPAAAESGRSPAS